jgi:CubicO group peptidase (beta-lactamase class C family)
MIARKAYGLIALAAVLVATLILACALKPRPTPPPPVPAILNETLTNEMSDSSVFRAIDREVREFMSYWKIQGISLSVMRNDSLMFSKGYGWADKEKKEEMTPRHILRMASVSKLITATGIMKLEEQGRLSLDDKVFGPDGILCDSVYTALIKDSLYYDITVEHLLRHQAGFSTRGGDPMFSTRTIMIQNRLRTPPDHETLVRTQLGKSLAFAPGETQEYSNFGFLLLSMIIEKVTGTDYETWMQESVLRPAGCLDFHIANNYYQDKYPNEVKYYVQSDDKPVSEYNNSGRNVVRCYGGNDIRALSGAGAWAASTAELCRFVASIDGRPEVPDIISVESVRRMTEWFDPDTFSLGWNDTKPTGEWTRTGTFSGTSALVKYFPDGECWVLITNTSTWRGAGLAPFTTEMFQKSRAECSDLLPRRNMFYVQEESFPE